uniref:uncharacterized protein LOC132693229 n=1 Tax=Panthera onca TaxID=9690 RepID=UPI0029550E57|nr:uncharacterized protein LOC132693229 [Panthera onca]
MPAAPRNACWTLLLPVPCDCGQVPASPRKSSRDSVAAGSQGLWKITTHIWRQASPLTTLFQHQRMWPFSGICWDQVVSTVSTKCPSSSGTAFPRVDQEPPGPHSAPGDSPFPSEHLQGRSQDGRTAWKLFACLVSMKYSQTNTKPSYTPRKLIGRLTQQSAQPEPQNSAGTQHGELNLGSKKLRKVGNPFCRWREDGDWGEGSIREDTLPKSSWRES